jgi:drug/metabolite transporter (DMT)-like permease
VGASFTANSVLAHYPYLGGQAVRYGVAALLLSPLLIGSGALRALTPRLWLRLAVLAATGMVGFNVAVIAAERTAEPAVPGVFVGCAPLVVAVLAPLLRGRRPTARLAVAAGVVAVGAAVVQGFGRTDTAGVAFSVLALAGEVAFALVAVPLLTVLGAAQLSALACAVAAAEATVLGIALDGSGWLRLPDTAEAAALGWQAVVVTVVGFVCWYAGMRRIGPERATLFSGLIPVSAALTAPLVGAGGLGPAQVVGSALVGAAVAFGATGGTARPRREADPAAPFDTAAREVIDCSDAGSAERVPPGRSRP